MLPHIQAALPSVRFPAKITSQNNREREGALTESECKQLGVPVGSQWKKGDSEMEVNRVGKGRTETAPSPVLYGGYMPTYYAGSISPVDIETDNTKTWQA